MREYFRATTHKKGADRCESRSLHVSSGLAEVRLIVALVCGRHFFYVAWLGGSPPTLRAKLEELMSEGEEENGYPPYPASLKPKVKPKFTYKSKRHKFGCWGVRSAEGYEFDETTAELKSQLTADSAHQAMFREGQPWHSLTVVLREALMMELCSERLYVSNDQFLNLGQVPQRFASRLQIETAAATVTRQIECAF
jgi:hypothetical protein